MCPVEIHVHGDGILNVIDIIFHNWVLMAEMLVYTAVQCVQCEKIVLYIIGKSVDVTVVC